MSYYVDTAAKFAEQINIHFATEDTLKALFESYFPGLPFDRTDHWNGILTRELYKAWYEAGPAVKSNPVQQDIFKILQELHMMYKILDYNLYTQVAMNLQNYVGFAYQASDATLELAELKKKWDAKGEHHALHPFVAKAKKLGTATTEEETEYNSDLSAIKALRIIAGFGPLASFRVSPKGSTPAFADSKNISMIGQGGDRFIKTIPNLKVYFLTWDAAPGLLAPQADGSFRTPMIDYPFVSKSGGQILNEVLYSRYVAYQVWGTINMVDKLLTVIPRMNSVMVVAPHVPELEELAKTLGVGFHVGTRFAPSAAAANE